MMKRLRVLLVLFFVILYFSFLYNVLNIQDMALFGYIVSFYIPFIIVNIGVSYAVYKLVLEYQVLGYHRVKKKCLYMSYVFSFILYLLFFLSLFLIDPLLFWKMKWTKDTLTVIRFVGIISCVQPFLNSLRGYFYGHHLEKKVFFSYFIEFVVSFISLFFGFFIRKKILLFILFGFLLGSIISFLYLLIIKKKSRVKFDEKIRKVHEKSIPNIMVGKQFFSYIKLFLVMGVICLLCIIVDYNELIYHASFYGYDSQVSEGLYGNYFVWNMIFNLLLIIISALVYKKDFSINLVKSHMIHKTLLLSLTILIPVTLLISFLAKPIWLLLYSDSVYGFSMLSYSILMGFVFSIYVAMVLLLKRFGHEKPIYISLFLSFFCKMILTSYLMRSFIQIGLSSYYGMITASMASYLIATLYCLIVFAFHYKVSFEFLLKGIIDIICCSVVMMIFLLLLKLIVPTYSKHRIINLFLLLIYMSSGIFTYYISCLYMKIKDKFLILKE